MFMLDDINMNYVHKGTNSCKEMLRNKMMNREAAFQAKLYEIRRLYREQRNLMEEYKQIESDSFYVQNRSAFSRSYTPTDPAIYSIVEQTHVNACKGASCMLPNNADLLSKHHATNCNPWLRSPDRKEWALDLQLPVDEFISCINHDVPRSESWRNPFDVSYRLMSSLSLEKVSNSMDSKLSLGIRDATTIKKSEHRKKKCQVIPHDVIDLEDPSFSLPSENQRATWSSGMAASSFVSGMKRYPVHEFTGSRCVADIGPSGFRQTSFSSEFSRQQTEMPSTGHSSKKPLYEIPSTDFGMKQLSSLSPSTIELDLNLPLVDTSLSLTFNSAVLNSVSVQAAVSQPVNPRSRIPLYDALAPCSSKSNGSFFHEFSSLQSRKNVVGVCFENVNNKIQGDLKVEAAKSSSANGSKLEIIDLECPSGSSLDGCEDIWRHQPEQKNGSAGSVCENSLSLGVQMDVDGAELNLNKPPEDAASMYPFQGLMESESNADKQSDSIHTLQSGVEFGDSLSELGRVSLGSHVELSAPGEPDQRSLESTESKNHCAIEKQAAVRVDESVQVAAEAIVWMYSQIPASHQVYLRSRQLQGIDNRPEHSSDSYELLVLKQRESDPTDYEVSSKEVSASEPDRRGSPYKLKRGTRMRDFQKDVLPALSRLPRHEICKDVSILENAIRSREYKRMRTQMGDKGTSWCSSTRSRRSRTNYMRRYVLDEAEFGVSAE